MNRYLQHVAGCFKIRSIIPRARGRRHLCLRFPIAPRIHAPDGTHCSETGNTPRPAFPMSDRLSVEHRTQPTPPTDTIRPATIYLRLPISADGLPDNYSSPCFGTGPELPGIRPPSMNFRIRTGELRIFDDGPPSVCLHRPDSVSRPGKRTDGIRDMFRFSRRISRSVFFTGRVAGDGKIPYF